VEVDAVIAVGEDVDVVVFDTGKVQLIQKS
jgi:hypothetical protein